MSKLKSSSIPDGELTAYQLEARLVNQALAVILLEARKEAGFTMRALADLLESPHSLVGKIEKQDRRVDVGEFSA